MKRFALVCGASGSIGSGIAKALAASGWSLYLHCGKALGKTQTLHAELSAAYPEQEFSVIQVDFLAPDAAERIAANVFSLNAIVFAGGQAQYGMLEDHTADEMRALWQVHVETPMRLCQLLSVKLRVHPVSYVVMISSIWGVAGASGEVVYSTVKGAQNSFVKAYAKEVAPSGIRVNAVAPGIVDTVMNGHLDEDELDAILSEIPLGKLGHVDDIANMVRFLVSGEANYMTGQIVQVNGGWYI